MSNIGNHNNIRLLLLKLCFALIRMLISLKGLTTCIQIKINVLVTCVYSFHNDKQINLSSPMYVVFITDQEMNVSSQMYVVFTTDQEMDISSPLYVAFTTDQEINVSPPLYVAFTMKSKSV